MEEGEAAKAPRSTQMISRGNALKPTVLIGKAGLGPGVVDDAMQQLKAAGLIKVKILASMDRKDVAALAEDMARRTSSGLLQIKGRTFLLYKA
jgi:RNA-binding protein YhbY